MINYHIIKKYGKKKYHKKRKKNKKDPQIIEYDTWMKYIKEPDNSITNKPKPKLKKVILFFYLFYFFFICHQMK